MLRQKESKAFLGKYLNDLHVPWRLKRHEIKAQNDGNCMGHSINHKEISDTLWQSKEFEQICSRDSELLTETEAKIDLGKRAQERTQFMISKQQCFLS